MNIRKILFIGGNATRLASVQIRCVDIAERLGCDYALKINSLKEIPRYYSAFVCVKPGIDPLDLPELNKRGPVIWDVIDSPPPKQGVSLYLTSSKTCKGYYTGYGRVEYIHHHHCNFGSKPNPASNRRPGWIGGQHWTPNIPGFKFDRYAVERMSQEQVQQSLRKIGIGLNFRLGGPWPAPNHPDKLYFDYHLAINSGIKLINCIGFGIPSVSGLEPAYREIGQGCTIFCDPNDCVRWVKELQKNKTLYSKLRQNCLKRAKHFHIDSIVQKYKKLLKSL